MARRAGSDGRAWTSSRRTRTSRPRSSSKSRRCWSTICLDFWRRSIRTFASKMEEIEKQQGFDIRERFCGTARRRVRLRDRRPDPADAFVEGRSGSLRPGEIAEHVRACGRKAESVFDAARQGQTEPGKLDRRRPHLLRDKIADAGLEVNYTYANGYLVAAPSRALLEQSISNREAGNTLVRSSRFMSSLPQDGNTNFSAIFYHDLAPLIQIARRKNEECRRNGSGRQ